jgi:hypothetical protein
MSRSGVVALVSGGLDSWFLVQTLRKTRAAIHPVYVRCGLAWEPAELFWLREWLAKLPRAGLRALKVLHVPVHGLYGRHWSVTGRDVPASDSRDAAVYLPGRNILLLAHAAVYGIQQGLSTIALGTLAGNPFKDDAGIFPLVCRVSEAGAVASGAHRHAAAPSDEDAADCDMAEGTPASDLFLHLAVREPPLRPLQQVRRAPPRLRGRRPSGSYYLRLMKGAGGG